MESARTSGPQAAAFVVFCNMRCSVDALPDDAESLKRLLLAREAELAVARDRRPLQRRSGSLRARPQRPGDDRASEAANREAPARAVTASDRSAAPGCSIRWNCSSKSWRRRRPRMNSRPRRPLPRPPCRHSTASGRAQAVPRAPAARAGGRSRPDRVPLLWRRTAVKLGEDITETLEVIPRQWKVIQHVREKFSCRDCESISQAPAPFHVIARGWAGPEPAGDVAVREVRPASAAQPPG